MVITPVFLSCRRRNIPTKLLVHFNCIFRKSCQMYLAIKLFKKNDNHYKIVSYFFCYCSPFCEVKNKIVLQTSFRLKILGVVYQLLEVNTEMLTVVVTNPYVHRRRFRDQTRYSFSYKLGTHQSHSISIRRSLPITHNLHPSSRRRHFRKKE